MILALFWIFAALMLGFGIAVIANRSPVASALCLVMSFLGLAALFVMLDAFFIGTVQILVYAGAVMVLFLFIIMLMDMKAEKRRKIRPLALIGSVVIVIAFVAQLRSVLDELPAGNQPFAPLSAQVDDVKAVGEKLFTLYTLPFQVIGTLILVASIGVVVLSKKELK
ncbi:MAG: NADH-quinone oxidoreductase subunit J [Chthoniobacteraceae bacterium]